MFTILTELRIVTKLNTSYYQLLLLLVAMAIIYFTAASSDSYLVQAG